MTQQTFSPAPSTSSSPYGYAQPSYDSTYPQQQYGQPSYQQQYAQPVAEQRSTGVVSSLLGAVGIGAVAVSFTVLEWFRKDYDSVGGGASGTTFNDLHDALDKVTSKVNGTPFGNLLDAGMAPAYYSWLGWALLAVAGITTAIATSAAGTAIARGIAVLASVAGLALTAINLQLFTVDERLSKLNSDIPTSYFDWVKHSSFGAWAAVAGFLFMAIAAAIGPRRR